MGNAPLPNIPYLGHIGNLQCRRGSEFTYRYLLARLGRLGWTALVLTGLGNT